jgi:hypothetical protein
MIAIDVPALIGLLIAVALCLYVIYHGVLLFYRQPRKRKSEGIKPDKKKQKNEE